MPSVNKLPNPNPVSVPAPETAPAAPALYSELLLYGEEPDAHDAIMARFTATVAPADILEEVWVEDVVALVWEAFRLRRFRSCLLISGASKGVASVLCAFFPYTTAQEMATEWAAGEAERVEHVNSILEQADLTMEHVMAETWAVRQEELERLDRMIASAEDRRNTALREIERHRAVLASPLRRATEEVEAEYEDAAPALPAPPVRAQ